MRQFTPDYTVSYQGRFYKYGEQFEINDSDVDMMRRHGRVEDEPLAVEDEPPRRKKAK